MIDSVLILKLQLMTIFIVLLCSNAERQCTGAE